MSCSQRKEQEIVPVLMNLIWKLRIWNDTRGQELLEYALIAGFVATICGAMLPGVASDIVGVFSKVVGALDASWKVTVSPSSA